MLEYNPETHVAVPKEELAKLEEARVELYSWLDKEGFFGKKGSVEHIMKCSGLVTITQQIWNVANRLKWE